MVRGRRAILHALHRAHRRSEAKAITRIGARPRRIGTIEVPMRSRGPRRLDRGSDRARDAHFRAMKMLFEVAVRARS
ncbi:hypothetical protein AYO39_02190 [Actinobacteria bacterium SCGC AG-212-D09]|nr:hypothetical protein AYO39_02190 [Actinobacteria bacterium SCGC AG-212-D09]